MKIIYSKPKHERELNKVHGQVLAEFTTLFVKDCMLKSESEIKQKYKEYEHRWVEYVNKNNNKNNGCILYTDSFESHMIKFYEKVNQMGDTVVQREYKRIVNVLVEKSRLNKLAGFLKNAFKFPDKKLN